MNVKIRPLQESDAYTSVKWRNIPEIWVHTEFVATREITIEDELKWIKKVIADPTCRRFAILADEVYVGNIYLTGIKDGSAEYHIFIGNRDYWGKGVAKAASKLILEYAKDVLKLNHVELRVKKDNVPAFAMYQKLGFREAGAKGDFVAMTLDLEVASGV